MNSQTIKAELEAAQAREKQLAADLIPAREEWGKARRDHTYGRCDAVQLALKQERALLLEQEHIKATASTHQLSTTYRDATRLESGEVYADLRAQAWECL